MATPIPGGSVEDQLLAQAKADAARRAGVSPAQVTVVETRAVEWPDGSLGCPQPGMMYPQVVTPGYRFLLQAAGKSYDYHADRRSRVFLCENPS